MRDNWNRKNIITNRIIDDSSTTKNIDEQLHDSHCFNYQNQTKDNYESTVVQRQLRRKTTTKPTLSHCLFLVYLLMAGVNAGQYGPPPQQQQSYQPPQQQSYQPPPQQQQSYQPPPPQPQQQSYQPPPPQPQQHSSYQPPPPPQRPPVNSYQPAPAPVQQPVNTYNQQPQPPPPQPAQNLYQPPQQSSYSNPAPYQPPPPAQQTFPAASSYQPQPAPSYPAQPRPVPQTGGTYGAAAIAVNSGPDLSDPCFRKYSNCIIVNAQPYERRSAIDITECKSFCQQNSPANALANQAALANNALGGYGGGAVGGGTVYSCRSIVFDNHNRVCDLFAHTGNVAPARLLQFNGRDYYEPTGAAGCDGTNVVTAPPIGVTTTAGPGTDTDSCDPQISRYLKIEGFELVGNDDDVRTGVGSEQECLDLCSPDNACASVEYNPTSRECVLSAEAAIPTGAGEIQESPDGVNYFEKICVEPDAAQRCPDPFRRAPQMILVGFAETVVDAASFEDCLSQCINSQANFGFACRSGMFYFEEDTLNCILNTETADTQPDLFTAEENDIVDYFETGCNARNVVQRFRSRKRSLLRRGRNRFRGGLGRSAAVRASIDEDVITSLLPFGAEGNETLKAVKPDYGKWTLWSPCDTSGMKVRYQRCRQMNIKKCPAETGSCIIGKGNQTGIDSVKKFESKAASDQHKRLIYKNKESMQKNGEFGHEPLDRIRHHPSFPIGSSSLFGPAKPKTSSSQKSSSFKTPRLASELSKGPEPSQQSKQPAPTQSPRPQQRQRNQNGPDACPMDECCPLRKKGKAVTCRLGKKRYMDNGKVKEIYCIPDQKPCESKYRIR